MKVITLKDGIRGIVALNPSPIPVLSKPNPNEDGRLFSNNTLSDDKDI